MRSSGPLALLFRNPSLARYGVEEDTANGLKLAVRLEPENPSYWYFLGRYQQYNLEQPNAVMALESYRKAIALNPRATDAWLDLEWPTNWMENLIRHATPILRRKKNSMPDRFPPADQPDGDHRSSSRLLPAKRGALRGCCRCESHFLLPGLGRHCLLWQPLFHFRDTTLHSRAGLPPRTACYALRTAPCRPGCFCRDIGLLCVMESRPDLSMGCTPGTGARAYFVPRGGT